MKKIAQFGTFDIDNFGDLLFPYIANYRLNGYDIVHVSPTSNISNFRDAKPSISYAVAKTHKFDAILVGGGNILSANGTKQKLYNTISKTGYPSLWIGAAALASHLEVPLIINAPSFMKKNNRKDKYFKKQ